MDASAPFSSRCVHSSPPPSTPKGRRAPCIERGDEGSPCPPTAHRRPGSRPSSPSQLLMQEPGCAASPAPWGAGLPGPVPGTVTPGSALTAAALGPHSAD